MIEVRGLVKSFGALTAVDGMELVARDGEITGLIGPNGAGKTTTFRAIYGLVTPDSGSTRVDGFDCARQRLEAQSRLGVLPDVRGLYPRLTPRDHLRYYGRLHGLDDATIDERIAALTDRLGMEHFVDRRARGFSRGQELKVALARALVHSPRNVILDEPTNGLDVVSSRAVRDLIREMRAQGACILLSSHIMAEVAALCDRLYICADGRVVAQGTPEELKRETGGRDIEEVFVAAIRRPKLAATGIAAQ